MKRILIMLFAILFVVSACQAPQQVPAENITADDSMTKTEMEEIPQLPVESGKNVELFGKDFSQTVTTAEVYEPVHGYLARPKEAGNYPGVVMIHEWWGLNDNIKEMAKILADEGYVVFAIDLYDGKVAADSNQAREYATAVRNDPDKAVADMKAAVAYLKEQQQVTKVASLGWCFGGQQSLQLSLNDKLDATVIYYGNLVNDTQQLSNIDWPVLGIFGENDTSIPPAAVKEFESNLNSLKVENRVYIYPGVGHAFANPSGGNYAKDETIDAWAKTVAFLNSNLKEENTVEFTLTGENFKFLMDGKEAPELRVKEGSTVKIHFTSTQGFHDWVVDEFNAATARVWAVNATTVSFIADKKGTFEYYCSVGKHRQNGMKGNLVVE